MSLRHSLSVITLLLLTAALCATASGQNGNGIGNSGHQFGKIPDGQQSYLNALGIRGKKKGKEKTVYTGQLFDKDGKSKSVRIICKRRGKRQPI